MVLENVKGWLGRKVRINEDGLFGTHGEVGTVLAVDDTPWQPAAWVRVHEDRDYPAYRSVNLFWLDDIETGNQGPAWGTNGPGDSRDNHSTGAFSVADNSVGP